MTRRRLLRHNAVEAADDAEGGQDAASACALEPVLKLFQLHFADKDYLCGLGQAFGSFGESGIADHSVVPL